MIKKDILGTIAGEFKNEAELLTIIKDKFSDKLTISCQNHSIIVEGDDNVVEAAKWWLNGFIMGMQFQADAAKNITIEDLLSHKNDVDN